MSMFVLGVTGLSDAETIPSTAINHPDMTSTTTTIRDTSFSLLPRSHLASFTKGLDRSPKPGKQNRT